MKYTGKVTALTLFILVCGGAAAASEPRCLHRLEGVQAEGPWTLDLTLPDGRTYTATGERTEIRAADDWSRSGRLYLAGRDIGPVYLTAVAGKISGLFYGLDGVFALTPVPEGHRLVSVESVESAGCGLRTPGLDSAWDAPALEEPPFGPSAVGKMTPVVDLVVLYTRASRDSAGGGSGVPGGLRGSG